MISGNYFITWSETDSAIRSSGITAWGFRRRVNENGGNHSSAEYETDNLLKERKKILEGAQAVTIDVHLDQALSIIGSIQ